MSEIMLIDKPSGITSFDVIRILRKKLGIRKMGHAGTLDPLASGLMIIGIGEATRRLGDFLKLPKVYLAEVLLGVSTDTGDITGKILQSSDCDAQNLEAKIKETLNNIVGKLELPVPAYSAIKRDGEALYKKARRGEKIELPVKTMQIFWLRLHDIVEDNQRVILNIELEVSSGTYIRSIAEEIGRKLNLPATIKSLRRTKIGDFEIKDATKLDTNVN